MKQVFSFIAAMLAMIMICHAQANRQLSNLNSPTAVNVDLLPGGTTGTKNLGSFDKRWKNGYFNGTVFCYGVGGSYGVFGVGNSYGVYGFSTLYGVYGNGKYGVYGYSGTGVAGSYGVYGKSANGIGVYGASDVVGVHGEGGTYGVFGSGDQTGVWGDGSTYGIYGRTSTTGWAGYFSGKVYSSGGYYASDQRLKQNIRDFTSALDIINKLKPKQYEFRQDGNYKLMNLPLGSHYGLIAQDVEKILPHLVNDTKFETAMAQPQIDEAALQQTEESVKTETKSEIIEFKALNYTELIPVLIKAIQEVDQENTQLKSELETLRQLVNQYIKPTAAGSLSKGTLGQNYPNPFTKSTAISFAIPTESNSASIVITQTGSGKIIKTLPVSIGTSQLNLDAASLAAGTYAYTLYVDGKKVDTKQMVITR
jgi:hypothetical protein